MRNKELAYSFILVLLVAGLQISPLSGQTAVQQVQSGSWAEMGPSSLQNCGTGSQVDLCTGRVTAIAIDPNNPNTIYVGGAQGGVWKSTDNGATWVALTDQLTDTSLAVGSIAIAPNGDIYVGTGEGNNSGDSYYGSGILKSTDGGNTWTRLAGSTFGKSTFTKLIINPIRGTIIAATNSGHTSSSTVTMNVDPGVPLGVYVSSDGGKTWTLTLKAKNEASDLVLDPLDPSVVYAAVDGAVYVSKDAGSNWTGPMSGGLPKPENVGRVNLGISTSSHLSIFAAIEDTSRTTSQGSLYETNNGGSTWALVNPPPTARRQGGFCADQCDYDMLVAVDPTDPNTIYLGGLDLYRTTDGGSTWIDIGGYVGFIHPDQHAFAFSPTSHSTIYVGNDGGIWSSNSGNTCSPDSCWTDLNYGLGLAQFQSVAAHPSDKTVFLGGTQDNGVLMRNGSSSIWTEVTGGDGGWVAIDPKNPLTMYHAYAWSEGGLERSEDGGANWISITDKTNGVGTDDKGLFYVPVAMDPVSTNTLYLGTYRLYKTTSRGNGWFQPSPGLGFASSGGCSANKKEDCISAIAVAPSNDLYVYVGTTTGKFFASSDGGNSFSENDHGLPTNALTSISVDPASPTKVYATFSGFGAGHVFLSTDVGISWSDISSNLPDVPTNTFAIDASGRSIFAGTDKGVYFSTDQGHGWAVLRGGLPSVSVDALAFAADGKLVAATHGRGVWVYTNRILVTFSEEPPGVSLVIDGVSYSSQQLDSNIFEWVNGTAYTLQVTTATVPGGPGVRYNFVQWNDGLKNLSRTIVASKHGDFSALFKVQYELKVVSSVGNPQGDEWYDEGSNASFSVTSPTPQPGILGLLGGKMIFRGWTGDSTANSAASTIFMDGPKTVQANWASDNSVAEIALAIIITTLVAIVLIVVTRRRHAAFPKSESNADSPHEQGI